MKHDLTFAERLVLPNGAVQVWLLDLPGAGVGESLWETLTSDEVARAGHISVATVRTRWVAARAGLRSILAAYTGRASHTLRFRYGAHGKPALVHQPGDPDLRFNLSHSRSLALIAVASGREVGVDIEAVHGDRRVDALAARVLSSRELAAFTALPRELRVPAFYRAWTRKEAYVKARGEALWLARQSFDVSLAPNEPARLLDTWPDPREAARWTLRDIDVGAPFVAALAYEASDGPVVVERWR